MTRQEPMLALVVDNDRFFRELLQEILSDLGYTVTAAADGLEALEAVMHNPPDIIFLDLVMPKVGGDRVWLGLGQNSIPGRIGRTQTGDRHRLIQDTQPGPSAVKASTAGDRNLPAGVLDDFLLY